MQGPGTADRGHLEGLQSRNHRGIATDQLVQLGSRVDLLPDAQVVVGCRAIGAQPHRELTGQHARQRCHPRGQFHVRLGIVHHPNAVVAEQIEFMGFGPHHMGRHHPVAQQPEPGEVLHRPCSVEPQALLNLVVCFRKMDDQGAGPINSEGLGFDQMIIRHGVRGMGSDRRRDQRVPLPAIHETRDAGHGGGMVGGIGSREVDQDLTQQPPQPRGRQLLGYRHLVVVHIADGGDAAADQLGDAQASATTHERLIHVHRLSGEDRVLQPIIEILIVGQAAEQGHRQMGMAIDQAGDHRAAAGIDALDGPEGRLDLLPLADRHDLPRRDRHGPIGNHTPLFIHRHHQATGDNRVGVGKLGRRAGR